jgi:hypothetical protein
MNIQKYASSGNVASNKELEGFWCTSCSQNKKSDDSQMDRPLILVHLM